MTEKTEAAEAADREARRRAVLNDLGLMTEDDLALVLGVKTKTLRNRPASDLPESMKAPGFRERLFRREAVTEFLTRKPKRRRAKTGAA